MAIDDQKKAVEAFVLMNGLQHLLVATGQAKSSKPCWGTWVATNVNRQCALASCVRKSYLCTSLFRTSMNVQDFKRISMHAAINASQQQHVFSISLARSIQMHATTRANNHVRRWRTLSVCSVRIT